MADQSAHEFARMFYDGGRLLKRNCPFCGRVERGEFDDSYREVVWFEPLNPVTPGHMLFVPKYHVEHPHRTAVGAAMEAAVRYAMAQPDDYNLITSSGPSATQTVAHIHVHYVPRRRGDALALPWTAPHVSEDASADV